MKTGKAAACLSPRARHSALPLPAESAGISLDACGDASGDPLIKAPRPTRRSCQRYMRQRLTADLPRIADALLEAAREGRLPELKMTVQLSGLDEKNASPRKSKRRERSFTDILYENLRKESLHDDGCDGPTGPDG